MTKHASARPVLMVGSVPLESAQAVFAALGRTLGDRLARYPDGETGARKGWIGWQRAAFERQAALDPLAEKERHYQFRPPFRLRPDADAAALDFGALGYAEAARESYAIFRARREAGDLPQRARFQVALPTAWAPVYSCVAYESQGAVYPAYEVALLRDLAAIVRDIPAADLAIQWDVATEMSWLEGVYPAPFADVFSGAIESLARLGEAVPMGVELGIHLCYGSMNNKHWKEPADTALMVRVMNALARRLPRPIDWFHIPVPQDRADDAYFAALAQLRLAPATRLFLGLIHDGDGLAGTQARIAAARRHRHDFGIACECGLGRRDPADVPALLALHAAASD
jgi:hypothetical protein